MRSLKGEFRLLSSSNNTKSYAVAFILLLAVSAMMATVRVAFAQVIAVPDKKTTCSLSVAPHVIGLGQEALVTLWVAPSPNNALVFAQGGGYRYYNISITFTKPDGSTDTFMPQEGHNVNPPGETDRLGGIWFQYKPDQIGTWNVKFSFPGLTIYDPPGYSVYYKPSASPTTTFTVQEEQVLAGLLNGWPWVPLPSAYWERPISGENREWSSISGNWIQSGYDWTGQQGSRFNPYSTGPNSAHILWKNEVSMAGLVGGVWGSQSFGGGGGTIVAILNGKVYYNDVAGGTFRCVDERTGETLWQKSGSINNAQILLPKAALVTAEQSSNIAPTPSLWSLGSTSWLRYDAFTGALLQTITNVPVPLSGLTTLGGYNSTIAGVFNVRWMEGSEVGYGVFQSGWNTTKPNRFAQNNLIKWNYSKVTGNSWPTGIMWNVSIAPDGPGPGDGRTSARVAITYDGTVGCVLANLNEDKIVAFDLSTGTKLWNKTLDYEFTFYSEGLKSNGPLVLFEQVSSVVHGIDMKTGQELWKNPIGVYPWGDNSGLGPAAAYDNVYFANYDGHHYIVNVETGKVTPSDHVGNNTETPYETFPTYGSPTIADGKVYFGETEHSPSQPLYRGWKLFCMDAYTGKFLWNITSGIVPSAIADGILYGTSQYDGHLYAISKGQTATTVSAPLTTVDVGTGVLIQGTVMDQSPAQPNTPAVSEADMSEWMEYLHMQNATLINSPPSPNGVPVELRALASDGSVIDLGIVTTNSYGQYSLVWAPTKSDKYTVFAAFPGSNSYWSSSAATALSIGPAAETPSQQPATAAPDNTMTIIGVGVALAIIIAIVGALLFLALRKRQ